MSESEMPGEAAEKTVEQRLNDLENRVRDLEAENATLREELHEERATREALISTLGDADPTEAGWTDIAIADNYPVGRTLQATRQTLSNLGQYVFAEAVPDADWIEDYIEDYGTLPDQMGEGEFTVKHDGLTDGVRQRLLPIHEMWMDVREGREEKVPGSSSRRGARLFGAMIRKASGENVVGVDATYGKYKITSKRARQMLEEAGDMTDSGKTMTVKRAMKAAQSASKTGDCGCDTLESCEHGLVVWENKNSHTLTADKDAFNAEMRSVQEAIEGEIDTTADDEGNSSEETGDETSAFDQLDQATAVTGDEEDTVESEVANDVVSRSESRALGGDQTPNRDTSQTR